MAKKAVSPPDLNTQNGRLRWVREARGYGSARLAARMLRINENTYKSHEYGMRRSNALPLDDAKSYAKKFRCNLSWLMTGEGAPFDEGKASPAPEKPTAAPAAKRSAA